MADDLRLLVDLLRHKMAEIAFIDQQRTRHSLDRGPHDFIAIEIEKLGLLAGQDGPIAVFKIGNRIGKRRERDGVRAKIHFALAMTNGQRWSLSRPDHQIVLAGENDAERESTSEALQC